MFQIMSNINHQALTKYSWMGHLPKVIASYLSHLIGMKTTLSMGYFFSNVSCAAYFFGSICWINWNQKLKLKTKIFFAGVNENSTNFLYTLNRVTRKQKHKKVFFFKVYNKVDMLLTKQARKGFRPISMSQIFFGTL